MYTDNMINYIKTGLGFVPEKKGFRKLIVGPLLLTIFAGVGPGILLKGPWLVAMILMMVISFGALVTTFVLSNQPLTTKVQLLLQTILYIGWVLTICLAQFMYYIMQYKVGILLFVLYLPVLLTPLLLGWKYAREMKKSVPVTRKEMTKYKVRLGLSVTGSAGIGFGAALFRDIEQNMAINVVLILFMILNTVLSIGLLSIQRLYYLSKLEHRGIVL